MRSELRLRGQPPSIADEIRAEMAASLGRAALRFERSVRELERRCAELQHLDGDAREEEIASLRTLRDDAMRYRWYLVVQREALGFCDHTELDRLLPIPRVA